MNSLLCELSLTLRLKCSSRVPINIDTMSSQWTLNVGFGISITEIPCKPTFRMNLFVTGQLNSTCAISWKQIHSFFLENNLFSTLAYLRIHWKIVHYTVIRGKSHLKEFNSIAGTSFHRWKLCRKQFKFWWDFYEWLSFHDTFIPCNNSCVE